MPPWRESSAGAALNSLRHDRRAIPVLAFQLHQADLNFQADVSGNAFSRPAEARV
jgi:hypothetical protein